MGLQSLHEPKVGDVVLYWAPHKAGEEIRQPIKATIEKVHELRNVSFARAPARQYGNSLDVVYFVGDEVHRASEVPYTADGGDCGKDEYWAWP